MHRNKWTFNFLSFLDSSFPYFPSSEDLFTSRVVLDLAVVLLGLFAMALLCEVEYSTALGMFYSDEIDDCIDPGPRRSLIVSPLNMAKQRFLGPSSGRLTCWNIGKGLCRDSKVVGFE